MVSEMRLSVVASSIDGNGIAKIDSASFEKLNLSEGSKIIVKYGTKSREMIARCDPIYRECTARLMAQDMTDLRVEPGKEVIVSKKGGKKKKEPAPPPKKGKKKGKRGRAKAKGNTASLDSF